MNQQTFSDVSARIGALELSAINAHDDGVLEAAHSVSGGPTMPGSFGCHPFADDSELESTVQAGPGPTFPPTCFRIDDEGLEGTATVRAQVGPTTNPPFCYRIDDGALEATIHAGPSTHLRRSTVCLNIDDRALEATVHAGPSTMRPACPFIDDGALEATVHAGPMSTMPSVCFRIDDDALETAAAHVEVGPTNRFVGNRCM